MEKKSITIAGISIWRLLAYFTIYSFLGYIIETIYAVVVYGVIESRQSFLYGPFCSVYGVGAVFMICVLQYFNKGIHHLFLGGFLAGSVTEYVLSFLGEKLLNTKWWDYSQHFLNLNGRICLVYSIMWGILGLYIFKIVNPRVDKLIDKLKSKFSVKWLKTATILMTVFLAFDCIISGLAVNLYTVKTAVENNIEISNIDSVQKEYDIVFANDNKIKEFVDKFWSDEKMVTTYPNLTLQTKNGEPVFLRDYYDIQPYFYKFDRQSNEKID